MGACGVVTIRASIPTCSEVNEWLLLVVRQRDAHGLPDAIQAAHITWGHLAGQQGQVTSHFLSCGRGTTD